MNESLGDQTINHGKAKEENSEVSSSELKREAFMDPDYPLRVLVRYMGDSSVHVDHPNWPDVFPPTPSSIESTSPVRRETPQKALIIF